jgi:signal transduction histidine kinase
VTRTVLIEIRGLRARLIALQRAELRRLLIALAALALAQSALATWITVTTDRDHDLAVDLASALVIGWSFAGTGLFAWWWRPGNVVGSLMFLTGLFWLFNVYTLSNTTAIFVLGYLLSLVSYGFLIHLLLVFPDGRLETRLERAVVIGGYVAVTLLQLTGAFLIDPALVGCEGCPNNPLLITDNQDLYDVYGSLQALFAIAVLTGLVVALVRRWRGWPLGRRTQFAPVLWAGGLSLSLISLQLAVDVLGAPDGVQQAIFFASLIPFALIPFAFLVGLLRSRISRAEAVGDLVAGLAASTEGRGLRDALAEALSDPSLELAYWVPESRGYVNAEGVGVELPGPGEERRWVQVTHDGNRVGAIVHSGRLDDAEELVASVASAAGLRMENERLDAELRARLEELRASRARIVEAGYRERRRVERDLHDGAQQRLLALAMNLKLARSRVDDDPSEAGKLLDEATAELEQATAELRELARGIHPGLLADRGLVPALEALASRAPVQVELTADVERRSAPGVEAAAYFLVSEALTNIAKHAEAERVSVRVGQSKGFLMVEVLDDGRGGADPDGSGLRGLADRVAALDGDFSVADRNGGGTVVRASIPLD